MRAKNIDIEEFTKHYDIFKEKIFIWMCDNEKSLHNTFEYCREYNKEWYKSLSYLWHTQSGRIVIKEIMQKCGNKPRQKHKIISQNM